jgi:photosystem II stability/assembly factor-like uncharacterized protein
MTTFDAMKKLLPLVILFLTTQLFGQAWHEELKSKTPNFFEYQRAFESYWIDKPHERGMGYNVYKRWEWFWEPRVGKEGVFPKQGHDYYEFQKFNNENIRRSDNFGGNWRALGPTKTPSGYWGLGRLNCIAFHPTDTNTFWVGSPSGGIWKTNDYGKSWATTSDRNPVLGVSSIAVHPTNPDTLYIATGDGDRGSLSGMTGGPRGDNKSIGVMRSVDGGNAWHSTGLSFEQAEEVLIRVILIHPSQPNILICAASNGIYRTENSGATWTRVIVGYFIDLHFKPDNPNVVYATTFVQTGAGNARVLRSLDAGKTFSITYTVADGARIALGTTIAQPELVHILVAHRTGGRFEGVYESTDSGATFSKICSSPNILANTINGSGTSGQGWYDLTYAISPQNANRCFVGGVNTWRSNNKGRSFSIRAYWSNNQSGIPVVHADKHHFIFHPLETETLFDCNDGGVYYSKDRGVTWVDISEGLDITQFYRFGISRKDTALIIAGSQDNGTRVYDSGVWREATGGDGMECDIDPLDDNTLYSSYVNGRLYRNSNKFLGGGTITISNNIPGRPTGAWVTPYKLDEKTSGVIVAGYRDVYKSTDYGNNWIQISNSLTNNQLLRSIALGKQSANVIYAADYFAIYRTFDNGQNWERIFTTSIPITMMEVDFDNDSVLFITHSAYVSNIKVTKIDGTYQGQNQISSMTRNLPNIAINCLLLHKGRKDAMYVGTDVGIYYRDNKTIDWIPFMDELPNVVVTEIKANHNQNLIYAATYGRGVWKSNMYSDFNPLELTKLSPIHNARNVKIDTEIKMTFSDVIIPGIGNIKVFLNDVLYADFSIDSSSIIISGNEIEVKLGDDLPYNTSVKIIMDKDAIRNQTHIPFEGIAYGEWEFETEPEGGVVGNFKDIDIYPNPAIGQVSVKCYDCSEPFDVVLYDLNGRRVLKEEKIESQAQISLQNIEAGLYLIEIKHKNFRKVRRLMVNIN